MASTLPPAPDYQGAFNLAIQQCPAAVASVASVVEVVEALAQAERLGLRVAVQSTGHGAGSLPPLQDTLLIRTAAMNRVAVDPSARTVTFEAGAQAAHVVAAAAVHGLAVPAGFAPTVGMTGYTLGGGIGWFARRRGFAAHHLVQAQLVTADGHLRTVDADHDPELLWALKGGGGAFGVVTRLTLRLEPIATVHGGALHWPIERARQVLAVYADWARTAPDDVTSVARLLNVPGLGRRVVIESVHATDPNEHERLLAPLRTLQPVLDTAQVMPVTALADLHGDPQEPIPVAGDHLLLRALDPSTTDALVEAADPHLAVVDLRHLGGALGRTADSPLGPVHAEAALHAIGMAFDPHAEAHAEDALARLRSALWRWDTGHVLGNFAERPTPAERIYSPEALTRLRTIARRVDPAHRFVSNLPL